MASKWPLGGLFYFSACCEKIKNIRIFLGKYETDIPNLTSSLAFSWPISPSYLFWHSWPLETHCEKIAISQKLRIWTWNSLSEDCNFIETPDFFKQILWGCFGLQMASEAKSNLRFEIWGPNLTMNHVCFGPYSLQKLVEQEEEDVRNRQLLYLRNSFAAAGKNTLPSHK